MQPRLEASTPRYVRKDSFYQRAQREGFRSRAVYKLDDLLARAGGIKRGWTVVELGCWPGGWLQKLAEAVGPQGHVVGVDLKLPDPLGPNVTLLELDLTAEGALDRIVAELPNGTANAVLSDAAPKLSGIADVDRAVGEELGQAALALALRVLPPEGFAVIKDFAGPGAQVLARELKRVFHKVSEVRPEGRRAGSKELYLLAQKLRKTKL